MNSVVFVVRRVKEEYNVTVSMGKDRTLFCIEDNETIMLMMMMMKL